LFIRKKNAKNHNRNLEEKVLQKDEIIFQNLDKDCLS